MEYVRVGNIVNTFGLKGELKVRSHTDFDDIRFRVTQQLYIRYQNVFEPVVIKTYRVHKGFILISFSISRILIWLKNIKVATYLLKKMMFIL